MKHRHLVFVCTIVVAILLASLACAVPSLGSNSDTSSTSPQATVRQWASSAFASSEYGTSDWSAQQAAGAPSTSSCGDQVTSWASANYAYVEWLEVSFATPVVPTQINIHETYTPGSIITVEVRDTTGTLHIAWQGTPSSVTECPRVFTVNISNADFKANSVRITLDQSVLADWDEIDAVELVGIP